MAFALEGSEELLALVGELGCRRCSRRVERSMLRVPCGLRGVDPRGAQA